MKPEILKPQGDDSAAIKQLLIAASLPVDDLTPASFERFLIARDGAEIVGAVGIEAAGKVGLLRSLVVSAAQRQQGLGADLVGAAERLAAQAGIETLYLLTTTAERYFASRGYRSTPRSEAPAFIANSAQFSSLCPSTSAFMSKSLAHRPYNVLILCTGNSARSILGEVAFSHLPVCKGKFVGYSAGSQPKGQPNPVALEFLRQNQFPTDGLRSKSWDEFAKPGAPVMDFVITVCDQAAGEQCPYWPGQPMTAHWGMPDPAAVEGSQEEKLKAFATTFQELRRRIELFASLPFDKLDRLALLNRVRDIARQ